MTKEPQQKIRERASPIDQNFQNIRSDYSIIKGDLIKLVKEGILSPENYQTAFIAALESTLPDDFVAEMKLNWDNDVAIGSYAIEAFAGKRIKQILDTNPKLEPKYNLEVTAKFVDEDKIHTKSTSLDSYLGEPRIINTITQDIQFMPDELREKGRDIEIINTVNKIGFYDTGKNKKISLDVPVTTEYIRLKNNKRYLIKNILYTMKEKKDSTAYDRASGRSVVLDSEFYNTIDQIRGLMGDVHKIEYKPEEDNDKNLKYLSNNRDKNNIIEINQQGEEAASQLHALRMFYDKKGQLIPKEIYDELKTKVLARAVIKGKTTSRMEWDIMTHRWHKWDREAIPHAGYRALRTHDIDQFRSRNYQGIPLPEDQVFDYILQKLSPLIDKDNIIKY